MGGEAKFIAKIIAVSAPSEEVKNYCTSQPHPSLLQHFIPTLLPRRGKTQRKRLLRPFSSFHLFVEESHNWCLYTICLQISFLAHFANLHATSSLYHHSGRGHGFPRACIHLYSEDLLKSDPKMK